jgi:hypothetical protein
VINGYYPTISDVKFKPYHKKTMKAVSGFRYKSGFYKFPYVIKLLQKVWKYRQPEKEGF